MPRTIDIASIAVFRIMFGGIMVWEVGRFLLRGWVREYYVQPRVHFTYEGFDWVTPWPGDGMELHFYALGVCAVFVTLGLFYRVSMALFTLGFAYVFLLEQARYLNHFYLIILVSLLMCFIPAHRSLSVDARLRPSLRSEDTPAWTLWLLRAQMGVVYFFGGIAKLNGDWLRGQPLTTWLAQRSDLPILGGLLDEPWTGLVFSYGGLLIDLLAVPMLLWRRTRVPAFVALVVFHFMNSWLFGIGIFPWLSVAMTLLFFPPSWPRRVFGLTPRVEPETGSGRPSSAGRWIVTGLVCLYMAIQILIPLRHWLYPGNPSWTEEGHRFSWHMKLRGKDARARFLVRDPESGQIWGVDPAVHLASWQLQKCCTRPGLIARFARYLEQEWKRKGYADVEVRADIAVSLNGRRPQPFVDPTADLTEVGLGPLDRWDWVLPLTEPLPASRRVRNYGTGLEIRGARPRA